MGHALQLQITMVIKRKIDTYGLFIPTCYYSLSSIHLKNHWPSVKKLRVNNFPLVFTLSISFGGDIGRHGKYKGVAKLPSRLEMPCRPNTQRTK